MGWRWGRATRKLGQDTLGRSLHLCLCCFSLTEDGTEEFLTVYEDVNNVRIKRSQVRCPRARGLSSLAWEMLLGRMAIRSRDTSVFSK